MENNVIDVLLDKKINHKLTFTVENNCHIVTKTTKQNPPLCQQQILKAAMCSRTSRGQLNLLPTRTVEYSSNPPQCPQPKDPFYYPLFTFKRA